MFVFLNNNKIKKKELLADNSFKQSNVSLLVCLIHFLKQIQYVGGE